LRGCFIFEFAGLFLARELGLGRIERDDLLAGLSERSTSMET
jgi:hypothetical protein